MAKQQIYDKIFKKILTLSGRAVVNFINGLFGTSYPTDSTVEYNWTEFCDDSLKRTIADTIIRINGTHCYHIEAQTYQDGTIVFRVFEYGYRHAEQNRNIRGVDNRLVFPEPKIIYIYADGEIPDKYELTLDFGTQGSFVYQVSTLQLNKIPIKELNERKMVILIPFYLLSLKKEIQKKRTPENLKQLKKLIFDDILGSIETNYRLGNISIDDAGRLKRLTKLLYNHLYAKYKEMEDLNEMTDESLILDYDIFLKEHNIESLEETVQWIEDSRVEIASDWKKIRSDKKEIEDNQKKIRSEKKEIEDDRKKIRSEQLWIRDEQQKIKVGKKEIEDDRKKIRSEQLWIKDEQQKIKDERQKIKDSTKEVEDGRKEIENDRKELIRNAVTLFQMGSMPDDEIVQKITELFHLPEEDIRPFLD